MKKNIIPIGAFQEKLAGLPLAQKALLYVATLLVLVVGFYFLLYQDQTTAIQKLKGGIVDQEKKLASLKAAAVRVDALQKELVQSEQKFTELLALLPDQKEIPGLLESVSRLGSKVGLDNVLFQPQPEQLYEFYAAIPIRLDLVGSFNDLEIFFDSVSRLDRILKVDGLAINRQKDKGGSLLQVGCTVVTYRFIDKPVQKEGQAKKK